ncbi:hypothetical protein Agub_g4092 [Astrephomene gubernaculifera]|uniref:Myosin motor domain-containing protein n=1 Tax=Astrephomene gubernaculifera TaxID=47775 RepID=A0AAD3HJX5_9CHLO|nr:hypothetical protein Agub_g4092 [Astrephomene gubernaculifera]
MAACVGARVWVSQDACWAPAVVVSSDGERLRVRREEDSVEVEVDAKGACLRNTHIVEDMTTLPFLHEPGVLYNLQSRYQQSDIYTYTGNILIAVNPFRPLPHLYGTSVIERYRFSPREQLPPHVYATACAAYRNMMRDGAGQAILVTGESGAGKTETAKLIMACLTHLGAHRGTSSTGGSGMSGVEQKILESNPLLEAFGNAKTLRNNNSSRFGKYVEIFFDPAAGGVVTGAAVRTYLLERSRVVAVNKPERSFHIFYQLVYGASAEDRAAWRLPQTAAGFAYLNRSNCFELPGQSNAEEYQHTRRAMSHIGLSDEQQSAVLATVAAVLHLGNITFANGHVEGDSSSGHEGAVVADAAAAEALETAAELLGVDSGALTEALTTRQIQTPEGPIVMPLTAQAATDARDSMAKVVYARLFEWLVAAVNTAVDEAHNGGTGSSNGGGAACAPGHLSIGLLDIYGFESFEVNDLEQLCINLTNEKLQQHFNQHVFKWEQAEYEREGVDWSYISFRDNADVLELLEGRMGIMDLLDETCRFPKATADDLATKYGSSSAVAGNSRFTRLKRPATSFSVEHYAGSVTYSTLNFLDKNRDYVVAEHQSLLGRSARPLLQELFAPEGGSSNGGGAAGGNGGAGEGNGSGPGRTQNQFQFRSVSSQCRRQLAELMAALSRLQPHYVRCIKPNASNSPGEFDSQYSLQQLRCGGVMEAVRIACAGYAYRRPYAAFLDHFWQLCPEPVHALRRRAAELRSLQQLQQQQPGGSSPQGDNDVSSELAAGAALAGLGVEEMHAAAKAVMAASGLAAEEQKTGVPPHHLGFTKVFLRATAAAALERKRLAVANDAATTIQAHFRRWQVERWYRALRQAVIRLQAHARGLLARRQVEQLRRERAVTAIQSAWRCYAQRQRFLQQRKAVVRIQATWRGMYQRRQYEAMRQERAALVLQAAWRGAVERRAYLIAVQYWRAAVVVQKAWRGYAARQLYAELLPLHRAALVCQRVWRSRRNGSQLGERLRSVVLEYMEVNRAAMLIQRNWRAKLARKLCSKLRLERKKAALLAKFGVAAAAQQQQPLISRNSPGASRHMDVSTPVNTRPRTLRHSGSSFKPPGPGLLCGSSAGATPMSAGPRMSMSASATPSDIVRADDVTQGRDSGSRVQSRLQELANFKVSPLLAYWQQHVASVEENRRPGEAHVAPNVSVRPRTAPNRRGPYAKSDGTPAAPRTHGSPHAATPSAELTSAPSSPPDTAFRGASSSLLSVAGASCSTSNGGASSRGGSYTSIGGMTELGSGALSCEPSYGTLLGGGRSDEVMLATAMVEDGAH